MENTPDNNTTSTTEAPAVVEINVNDNDALLKAFPSFYLTRGSLNVRAKFSPVIVKSKHKRAFPATDLTKLDENPEEAIKLAVNFVGAETCLRWIDQKYRKTNSDWALDNVKTNGRFVLEYQAQLITDGRITKKSSEELKDALNVLVTSLGSFSVTDRSESTKLARAKIQQEIGQILLELHARKKKVGGKVAAPSEVDTDEDDDDGDDEDGVKLPSFGDPSA